jgi:hypothetical protein
MHCIPKASLACLAASLSFAPVFSNPSTQAPGIDLQVAGDRAAIFAEGIISTPQEELSGTFSPDMREFYFTKSAPNYLEWFHTIVVSRFVDGKWTKPEVAPFSGRFADSSPSMSPDGSKLFFGSSRPVDGIAKASPEDSDLWVVERRPDGRWSHPRHLGPKINSPARDTHPSVAADGTLYFQSGRQRSGEPTDLGNLYRSRLVEREYQEAEDLGPTINTSYFEMDPFIAPDQSYLIFGSNASSQGSGGPQLNISLNRNGQWSAPQNLGEKVNGAGAASGGFVRNVSGRPLLFFNSNSGRMIRKQFDRPAKTLSYDELEKILNSVQYGRRNFYYIALAAVTGGVAQQK